MLGLEKGTAELQPRKYRVVLPDKRYAGEITVGVMFTKNEDGSVGGKEELNCDS